MNFDRTKNDDVQEVVWNRWKSAEEAKKPLHTKWEKYYEMYRAYRGNDTSTFSNLFIPHTFSTIEQILPNLVAGIFGSMPVFSVSPRRRQDVVNAKVTEAMVQYQTEERFLQDKLFDVIKDSMIYGSGILKGQWIEEEQNYMGVKYEGYEGPEPVYVSPFTFYPDPHATGMDDAEYVCENYFVTMTKLEEWDENNIVGRGAGGQSLKQIDELGSDPDKDDPRLRRLQKIGDLNSTGYHDDTRDFVEIVEYWEDDRVVMLANDNTVIRNEENPYASKRKPYFNFKDYSMGDEFFGIGEVEMIQDLQEEVNTQRNQRIDVRSLNLNPIVQVSPGSMIDNDDIVFEPGRIWRIEPGMAQPFALPDTGTPSVEEEQIATQNIKETTSVTDIVRGQSTQTTPTTATGVNRLDQRASTRFNMKIRNYEKPLVQYIKHSVVISRQFYDGVQEVRMTGNVEEYEDIVDRAGGYTFLSFEDGQIMPFVDVSIKGARSITEQQRQQRYLQVLQIGGQFASEFNVQEVLKRLFDSMGVKDVDKILSISEEQIRRMQALQSRSQGREQGPSGALEEAPPEGAGTRRDNEGNTERAGPPNPAIAEMEQAARSVGGFG